MHQYQSFPLRIGYFISNNSILKLMKQRRLAKAHADMYKQVQHWIGREIRLEKENG